MLTKIICDLIKFKTERDSLSEMKRLIDYLMTLGQRYNWIFKIYSFKSIPSISIKMGDYQPKIVLNGHLDVVSGDRSQYLPKIIGQRIYGRGSLDMKGSFATYLEIFKELSELNKSIPVEIVGVFDEETGGFNGTKQIMNLSKPDIVIIGEPTNMQVETESKGVIWAKIITHGKSAHAAKPWEGNNAIEKLNLELISLKKMFPNKKSPWQTTLNIGKISGGTSVNQLPDGAEGTLDIRRVAQDEPESLINKIKKGFIFGDTEIEVLLDEPVHNFPQDNKYTKKLINIISKYQKLEKGRSFFASDARHYGSCGIPAIVFGPTGEDMHGPNEYVNLVSLQRYKNILKEFIITSI